MKLTYYSAMKNFSASRRPGRLPYQQENAMKHTVDVHVGNRIRYQRWMSGITQKQLAAFVGIKFQQIQKYETGVNRVSASRLWDIANSLKVPVSFFFEGLEHDAESDTESQAETDRPCATAADKKAVDLLRYYCVLPENQQRHLFNFLRELSEGNTSEN
jgi:transcriptional regulator with XRE-family HTH domain